MPSSSSSRRRSDSSAIKNKSDATSSTAAESMGSADASPRSPKRKSLVDRARVFDPTFVKEGGYTAAELQKMLDDSDHRRSSLAIDGRRETYAENPGMGDVIVPGHRTSNPRVKALLDASDHRKKQGVHDGRKEAFHPPSRSASADSDFSIIPRGSAKPKKFNIGKNMQALLDASKHKGYKSKISYAHRGVHQAALAVRLKLTKNRFKPALPENVQPLPPPMVTLKEVQAPKLTVDPRTFKPPRNPKTEFQMALIRKAIERHTFVLKHQPEATTEKLINAMDSVSLQAGEILQTQGEVSAKDDHMFIVEEGELEVQVDGVTVETILKGCTFGQERLLLRHANKATVTATVPSKLFRLDQMTFRCILQKQYQKVLKELQKKKGKVAAVEISPASKRKSAPVKHKSADDPWELKPEKKPEELPTIVMKNGKKTIVKTGIKPKEEVKRSSTASAPGLMQSQSMSSTSKKVEQPVPRNVVEKKKKVKQPPKKKKVEKPKIPTFDFESSPVFQRQQAIRKSAQRHASNKDDLELIRVLGEGQFGEVWLVAAMLPDLPPPEEERQEFALKIQQMSDGTREDAEHAIRLEIKCLQQVHHPFIVNLVHTYESEDSIDMLLGLIPGGELWDEIHQEDDEGNWTSGIAEGRARFYSYVLTDTLAFLHSREFLFRDLKPENIMIDQDGYPILVDFGFAKKVPKGSKTFTFCGTPNYVAPEIISNTGQDAGVDYWALGVVIYEMVSGENPFYYDGMEQFALYQAIQEEEPYEIAEEKDASVKVRELIDELLKKDPMERLGNKGAQDILNHPWFKGMPNINKIRAKEINPDDCMDISVLFDDDDNGEGDAGNATGDEFTDDDSDVDSFADMSDDQDGGYEDHHQTPTEDRPHPDVVEIAEEFQEEEEEKPQFTSPRKVSNGIMFYSPPKTLKGYYAKMKSPEEKRSSQTRRSEVSKNLTDYLKDMGIDDDEFGTGAQ